MANFTTESNTYCFRIGPAFLDTPEIETSSLWWISKSYESRHAAGYIWTKLRMCWFTPSTKRLKWWLEFTLHTKAGSLGFCEGRHFNLFAAVRRKLPLPKMSPDPWCRVQSFPFPGLPKESQSSCEELLWSNHSEKGCGEYNSTTSADSSENTGSASKWTHRSHSVSSCGMGNYRWPLQSVQCTKMAALPLRTGKVCFSTVWCIVCWLER